jgi:hypothetical protein
MVTIAWIVTDVSKESAQKIESVRSSGEFAKIYQTIRRHIPEDCDVYS